MSEKLFPCPFCGNGAELVQGNDHAWIRHEGCPVDLGGFEDRLDAAAAWNRRATEPRVPPSDAHQRQPFTVTIWAEGDGENTALEAVHYALSAARHAGHSIEWDDGLPAELAAKDAEIARLREALKDGSDAAL